VARHGALDRAIDVTPYQLDRLVGDGIDRLFCAHHRRRLTRIGHAASFDPPAGGWAENAAPPRPGNDFRFLVDGAEAFPLMAEELRGARSHVHIAGWHVDPAFRLEPDGPALAELLASLGVDVRVLVWAGAPLPLFRPSRKQVRDGAQRLRRGRVRVELDARERPLHCHHEKLVIVDDRVAFVGGIDLTDLDGRRFDSSEHPPRGVRGWHDACTRIEGPAVGDVARHFALRWRETSGEPLVDPPDPEPAGATEVQVVRTVPERVYGALPRGEFSILESYRRALRSAERLIYLESQFLWSPEIVEILADKLRRPPDDRFRLLCVLPFKPNSGGDDTRGQLAALMEADGGAGRFLACALHQPGEGACPVYVHAKVAVVDDRWLTVGSANLNEHSLFNDTELNVVVQDPELARAARLRLWREHLERDDVEGDPAELIDGVWRPLAESQLARRESGEPLEHRLVRLPDVSKRARRLLGPLQGLLVDG
jgi:phosphatidylserine/phosphatidylglycerophosphate/cardiolipin synthase-like enzyme